jgi:hypothetical protein
MSPRENKIFLDYVNIKHMSRRSPLVIDEVIRTK